jgi:hypothetical protein
MRGKKYLFACMLLSALIIECPKANAHIFSDHPPSTMLLQDSSEPVKNTHLIFTTSHYYRPLEAKLLHLLKSKRPLQTIIGHSKNGVAIIAWYFPGTSHKNALVIGGVHGSELSSIEVTRTLITQLQKGPGAYYNTLIIPSLFPDNEKLALSTLKEIGSKQNVGRYSFTDAVDPNRQMPSLGTPYDPDKESDHFGRKIEKENALLLEVIQLFAPTRILSVHAIRDKSRAGIFADPRTDSQGIAIGFKEDCLLATRMAMYIEANGGIAPANLLSSKATARYAMDPSIAPAGTLQPRTICGSNRPNNKGCGISLGSWASTAVQNKNLSFYNRPAISIITVEFPGLHRPVDLTEVKDKVFCTKMIEVYSASIRNIFLK